MLSVYWNRYHSESLHRCNGSETLNMFSFLYHFDTIEPYFGITQRLKLPDYDTQMMKSYLAGHNEL